MNVTVFPGNSKPYVIPEEHPALPVVASVLEQLYGKEPIAVRLGGTLPIALGRFWILLVRTCSFLLCQVLILAHMDQMSL